MKNKCSSCEELSEKLYHASREASGIKYELGHEIEIYQMIQSEYEGKIQELRRQNEILLNAVEFCSLENVASRESQFHAREALEQVRNEK